ncbi:MULTISPECIES: recombinase family protein [unclassified Clostridium]|uniref:recombinase family protein n=1 Tax=unclassified Clostridium TaxID=2614128 RepID=UPI000297AB26|nr:MULTISPECIES: recombinase family protein [unclassified Clostridium]EKQ51798.1 MAG: site-specific recombinase, DNA invertase Pin [Clostridium sp. Maddingley MBC34-26]
MKISELLVRLEEVEFNTGNFNISNFYRNNKEADVSIGIYARISRKNSTLIDQQKKAIRLFLQWKIKLDVQTTVVEYSDDGFSGTQDGREGYSNMMRDLKLGKINVIVTTNIDRFGRATENIIWDIYPQGEVKYLYISLDNKIINAISNMTYIKEKAATADDYAKTCSIKARRGLETRIQEGSAISSKAAYGYKIEVDNVTGLRKYRLGKDEEIETVNYIFQKYLLGETLGDISRTLTSSGIISPSGKKTWNKSTIESILKNPLYSGQLYQKRYQKQGYAYYGDGRKIVRVEKDEWINSGNFEGIVDIETYNTVQTMLNENRGVRSSKSNKRAFTGVLRCGDCGRALIFKEKWAGYKCSGSQHKEGKCSTHFIKEDDIWNLTFNKLNDKIQYNYEKLKKPIQERINATNGAQQKQKRIEKNNEKIDNAARRIASLYFEEDKRYADSVITEIKNQITKIEKENKELERRAQEDKKYQHDMLYILENIDKNIEKENWVINLFIKEIKIYQDNKIEIIWRC